MSEGGGGAEPLVSCVMTVFNGETFIGEAIESVLAQTYPGWELLIVDDGSTDASRAIAERYQAAHRARIKILAHADGCNAGKSVSRNLGVRASGGPIIALLDADDIWLPGKLAAQVAIFERHPEVEFTYGRVLYHYEWTHRPQDREKDGPSRLGVPPDTVIAPPRLLTKMLIEDARRAECIFPYPSAAAFRRVLFDRVGGFEPDFLRLYDDAVFFSKALAVAKAYPSPMVVAKYRLHPGETLSYSYEQAIAAHEGSHCALESAERQFLSRTGEFLDAQGIRDRRLRRALARAASPTSAVRAHPVIRALAKGKNAVMDPVRALVRMRKRRRGEPVDVPPGQVRWGELGGAPLSRPVSLNSRGGAIADRHFDTCVRRFAEDVAGDAAEIADDVHLRRYRSDRLLSSTVLKPGCFDELPGSGPADAFDCVIAPDLVRFSRDPASCLQAIARSLKPGGVLHTSLTAIAPVVPGGGDRWRFTEEGARLLFENSGGLCLTHLEVVGGLRTATAVLHGLGVNDLAPYRDDAGASDLPVSIFVRAVKVGDPDSGGADGMREGA